ncbi:hypothetical protein [Streptomyces acidicola]|uniref:Uncharacterized protein n=1 Tax=Streptomyces acidicola TaxID=2596892 RepID=A0A5N8WVA9_9ACTN|nr:hypothetical protein [Streptomyces acidicola]MPY51330.1 hypothetical protein [Streptomyces acidicola]
MTTPRAEEENNYSRSDGSGSLSIAKLAGNVFISLLTGVEKWSVWNWVPCGLVFALGTVALLLQPDGQLTQFIGVYAAFLVPLAATFWRAQYGVGWHRGLRAGASWASVGVAVIGLTLMQDLRMHGEVDVTGSTKVTQTTPVGDGAELAVVVHSETARQNLRLTMSVAEGAAGAQSCLPDTTFDVGLTGQAPAGGNRSLVPGATAQLKLGGNWSGERSITVTVHTQRGCLMDFSVGRAVLHG